MTARQDQFDRVPAWYSGHGHLLLQNLLGWGVVLPALWWARGAPAACWLLVPATFAFANWVEWRVHKGPLHHRTPGLESWFQAHTVCHHAVFTAEQMAYEEDRELAYVLFPTWFVPLALLVFSPVAWALGQLEPHLPALFYASGIGYFLVYEWLHLLHHSPPRGWLAGSRWAAWLRRHHARHHDPARMTRGNFNISFPLWDYLLGTVLD